MAGKSPALKSPDKKLTTNNNQDAETTPGLGMKKFPSI
jgi:hypothetical protein